MNDWEIISIIMPTFMLFLIAIVTNIIVFKVRIFSRDISILEDKPKVFQDPNKELPHNLKSKEAKEYYVSVNKVMLNPYILMFFINLGIYILICFVNPEIPGVFFGIGVFTNVVVIIFIVLAIINNIFEAKTRKLINIKQSFGTIFTIGSLRSVEGSKRYISNIYIVIIYWIMNILLSISICNFLFYYIELILRY